MSTLFRKILGRDTDLILYGRDNLLEKIEDYAICRENPENVALLGLKGSGKSSVIQKAFDEPCRTKYYTEKKVIVIFVDVARPADSMKSFYNYLDAAILNGLDELERIDQYAYTFLMQQIDKQKNKVVERSVEIDEVVWESILSKTVETIKSLGYHLLLVIDDFDRFAYYSGLKAAQYSYLRELANSGKLSLFITTCQDLTEVSEEMVGSGFENIFLYEELRGIHEWDIEDWIGKVAPNMAADENIIRWISEVSGGIPDLICDVGDIVYDLLCQGSAFDAENCYQLLYRKVQPLMNRWWSETNRVERYIFKQVLSCESIDSQERDCLIKRGYLSQTDSGEIEFISPIFEEYVLKMVTENSSTENDDWEEEEDDKYLTLKNAILGLDLKVSSMGEQVNDMKDLASMLRVELESLDNYYNKDTGELDNEKYTEEIRKFMVGKLGESCDKEICDKWNIDPDIWDGLSDISKKDASTAYQLHTIVYSEEGNDLDYKPVTVFLGNFLEGILNERFLPVLKNYIPDFEVKVGNNWVALCDVPSMMIGAFEYVLKKSDISNILCHEECADEIKIHIEVMDSFLKKIHDCNEIRKSTDHHGEMINYESMKKFFNMLFQNKNSLFNIVNLIFFNYV